ncbi:MAG: hypothetical protein WB471_03880 [Nocardioides sp.]
MDDNPSLLPSQARHLIEQRLRTAAAERVARSTRSPGGRRHRLAEQLRSVAERLDV